MAGELVNKKILSSRIIRICDIRRILKLLKRYFVKDKDLTPDYHTLFQ